ncbi:MULTISPECIES: hypothetical protein [Providencia]|nr:MULTISPECIES: hypothetical protein [Providencia]ELF0884191.1 hypothetical protein [Morganella morganii]MCW2255688.1 hypothetical protein [Providencia alcalifaciens]HEJ0266890.1 hypothetical protein [Proteus mirabilis]EUD06042.1 hypothetical protein HMPREF1564_2577 [Providencia alcalifaciens R90-1475]MCG5279005.1 hypothetical protein [Providencia rettgeri]
MAIRSPHCDALRILFILKAGGSPIISEENDEVLVFKGEQRLQAFDFWMRNPDYLAAELIDLYHKTKEYKYYKIAKKILDDEEPDLRRIPMIRYLFGAYERLDDALSILRYRDLIRITGNKRSDGKVAETDFILTCLGSDLCSNAILQEPSLRWYEERSLLVAEVAGDMGGTALKHRQYERTTYAKTKLGGVIPSIVNEISEQLAKIEINIQEEPYAIEK